MQNGCSDDNNNWELYNARMRILLDAELARRVVGENAKPGTYSRPTKPRAQGSKELRQTLEVETAAAI